MVNDSGAHRDAAIKLKRRAKVQNLIDIGISCGLKMCVSCFLVERCF
jgi:hypothetical protein